MSDHRDVADATFDGVAVDPGQTTTWAPPRPVEDQVGEHHSRLAGHRGIGDPNPELDGALLLCQAARAT
jgi:hypothetical protein